MELTMDDIREIVVECVERIMENTNMKALYHFTSLSRLREIVKSDKLRPANYLSSYWDNNLHVSFTRHRNNLEGFARANSNTVRIQFNIDRLSSSHDVVKIKPMEFYSPKRYGLGKKEKPISAKEFYQKPLNRKQQKNEIEYYNQAEEGVQVYSNGISHLHKYVDRIDILFDKFDEACANFNKWIVTLSWFKEIDGSSFSNKVPIYVYTENKHFVLQDGDCMKLHDMICFFEKNVCDIDKEYSKILGFSIGSL